MSSLLYLEYGFLLFLSIQDWRYQTVPLWALVCLAVLAFLTTSFFLLVLAFLLILLCARMKCYFFKWIGGGDIVLMFILLSQLPLTCWPFFLITSGLLGIFTKYCFFPEKIRFPFVPALSVAFILVHGFFCFS